MELIGLDFNIVKKHIFSNRILYPTNSLKISMKILLQKNINVNRKLQSYISKTRWSMVNTLGNSISDIGV